jgi:hypothetical protein
MLDAAGVPLVITVDTRQQDRRRVFFLLVDPAGEACTPLGSPLPGGVTDRTNRHPFRQQVRVDVRANRSCESP